MWRAQLSTAHGQSGWLVHNQKLRGILVLVPRVVASFGTWWRGQMCVLGRSPGHCVQRGSWSGHSGGGGSPGEMGRPLPGRADSTAAEDGSWAPGLSRTLASAWAPDWGVVPVVKTGTDGAEVSSRHGSFWRLEWLDSKYFRLCAPRSKIKDNFVIFY